MPNSYSAESIQVLSGLEPVRRRPGMYTDTTRPDHMVMEVVDNSVDEVISGYATEVEVTLFADGSVEVLDDGRGMPVDMHPEHKLTGVELILTKLHAGGKFDKKNYTFLRRPARRRRIRGERAVELARSRSQARRQGALPAVRKRRSRDDPRDRRRRRQAQHRHAHRVRAEPGVFRHAQLRPGQIASCASGEGGAVSGASREP